MNASVNSSTLMNMSPKPLVKIKLQALMQGGKRLILEHGDKPYMLSITRKGKLILTAADENLPSPKTKPSSSED